MSLYLSLSWGHVVGLPIGASAALAPWAAMGSPNQALLRHMIALCEQARSPASDQSAMTTGNWHPPQRA
eukprot:6207179-Pleurochrysis_carterae.AAC.2